MENLLVGQKIKVVGKMYLILGVRFTKKSAVGSSERKIIELCLINSNKKISHYDIYDGISQGHELIFDSKMTTKLVALKMVEN